MNTGWSGGQYGVGKRMSIKHHPRPAARRSGRLADQDGSSTKDPFFGLSIPTHVPGIPDEVLDPRQAWADKAAYDRMAQSI